jgi:HrpA-like RNA helicase
MKQVCAPRAFPCSGKSSRVPQLLQQELNGPIICTQPRRLAVVAIARHVAGLTGSELGHDVGFRIGQKSVACSTTKILFTTAGLLLEELRANVSEGGDGNSSVTVCK